MRWCLILLAVLAFTLDSLCAFAQAIVAEPPAPKAQAKQEDKADAESQPLYLKIKESDDGKPVALQTATVRFEGTPGSKLAGCVVDLVGVVHIGEAEYYGQLNQDLAAYDKVLYELVAPDGTRIRPEDLKGRRSILASMQTGMKDLLNLQYQLEKVDYMAENFVHADMSPDEFAKDLDRRGDSVWKMVARMMGAGLATQGRTGGDAGMLMALFSNDRSKQMKRTMARQLIDMEVVTAGIDDANGENTLIKGRNAKAFQVLDRELKAGAKKLAVFYGAGHLSDMAKRLEKDFQMTRGETTWLTAWDLTRN